MKGASSEWEGEKKALASEKEKEVDMKEPTCIVPKFLKP